MSKTISVDLRRRVVAAVEEGFGRAETTSRCGTEMSATDRSGHRKAGQIRVFQQNLPEADNFRDT